MSATTKERTPSLMKPIAGRTLIPEQDFNVIAARIAAEDGMDLAVAESCLDQALAFVATSAKLRRRLGPSVSVDIAWHQLITYTRVYKRLADKLGTFVHHVPDDAPEYIAPDPGETDTDILLLTAAAIEEAGFVVDPRRWGPVFAAARGIVLADTRLNASASCSPDGTGCRCTGDCGPDCESDPDE